MCHHHGDEGGVGVSAVGVKLTGTDSLPLALRLIEGLGVPALRRHMTVTNNSPNAKQSLSFLLQANFLLYWAGRRSWEGDSANS